MVLPDICIGTKPYALAPTMRSVIVGVQVRTQLPDAFDRPVQLRSNKSEAAPALSFGCMLLKQQKTN